MSNKFETIEALIKRIECFQSPSPSSAPSVDVETIKCMPNKSIVGWGTQDHQCVHKGRYNIAFPPIQLMMGIASFSSLFLQKKEKSVVSQATVETLYYVSLCSVQMHAALQEERQRFSMYLGHWQWKQSTMDGVDLMGPFLEPSGLVPSQFAVLIEGTSRGRFEKSRRITASDNKD